MQPKIESIDYANVINFKNVRLIFSSELGDGDFAVAPLEKIVKKRRHS